MICGAAEFRPRKIMMIPAPTAAAPAPMTGTFGSDTRQLFARYPNARWLVGLCPRRAEHHHPAAHDREDDSTHPYTLPRLRWNRRGLLRRHAAQSIAQRPGMTNRRHRRNGSAFV